MNLTVHATRVLFVEDDENYREIVGDELAHHGFAVRSFADGDSLLGSLDSAAEADAIVLDWKLPGISGIDLLPELRQHGVNLPVVILTGRAVTADEECLAFERGAVDFIDKTRGVEILVSRLKLVAKAARPAANPEANESIDCGSLTLRPNVSRAHWNGIDVGLTVAEYNVVQLLVWNVGRYRTYREIYDLQYYEGFSAGRGEQGYWTNVRSIIKRIRRKFCKVDPTFAEIQTAYRLGYRWRGLTAGVEARRSGAAVHSARRAKG